MGVGVLLSVGLPDETPELTRRRCATLADAGLERVRVVPFEPTGGAPSERCRERGIWPPRGERWNREMHLPLHQPAADPDDFVRLFEEAVGFAAEIAARPRAPEAARAAVRT
jgi:hypothetical protein